MGTAPHRETVGPAFSEGARRVWLRAKKLGLSLADIQRKVGSTPGTVAHWLYGDSRPMFKYRAIFRREFGTAEKLWDEKPRKPFTTPAAAARLARELEAKAQASSDEKKARRRGSTSRAA